MNENLNNEISNLRRNTRNVIRQLNIGKIPTFINVDLVREYSWKQHGFYYSMYKDDSMLFCATGLPYTPNQKRHSFMETLDKLIENQEMRPFLLFLGGKFIKWSDILVIKTHAYTYLLASHFIEDGCDYNVMQLPEYSVTYTEDNRNATNETFIFDKNGKFVTNPKPYEPYTTINIQGEDIYQEKGISKYNTKTQLQLAPEYKVQSNNIVFFDTEGYMIHNPDLFMNGLNIFSLKDKSKDLEPISYISFYYKKNYMCKDNIEGVANKDYIADTILTTNGSQKYMNVLNKEFNFEFEPMYEYTRNINESLDYIMKYNPLLLSNYYKSKSNIVIKTYTGEELKKKLNRGYITMSRRIDEECNNYVIIFHNGLLYKYYHELVYENKNFKFPLLGVQDDDIIEIMYFKHIDNKVYEVSFDYDSEDDIVNLSSDINIEDMKLFTMSPRYQEFNIEVKDSIQYEIPFHAEKQEDGRWKMYPDDAYYYNKDLVLVSKRQFRHSYSIISDEDCKIKLPYDFKYCNDPTRFMVFLNGRLLSRLNYKLTIIKNTRPFTDLSLYITNEAHKGDIVDIFYVGEEMEEIYSSDTLKLSGNIVLDASKLTLGFDKDLFMVYVNGRKVLPDSIVNISPSMLQIREATDSIHNVSIFKYVSNEQILTDLFTSTEDTLTRVYNSLPPEVINKLFKKDTMKDTEEDMNLNMSSMKSVLQRIIRDYWAKPFINDGTPLLYDYDTIEGMDEDSVGNILSTALNGQDDEQL